MRGLAFFRWSLIEKPAKERGMASWNVVTDREEASRLRLRSWLALATGRRGSPQRTARVGRCGRYGAMPSSFSWYWTICLMTS
jgi:hypothetical protein